MSRPPEELVCRYLDGSASAQEVRQLDELLKSDPQVARLLVDMAALDTHLVQAIQQGRGAAEISADESQPTKTAPAPMPAESRRAAKPAWRLWTVAAAMAASVAVATAGWLHVTPIEQESSVAVVHRIHGTAYRLSRSGDLTPLSHGDPVFRGDVITTGGFPVARVTLRCPDATLIQFENSTRACILGEPSRPQVQLCYGEVSTDVPSGSTDPSFDVPTHEVMIAAAECNTKVGRDSCVYIQKDGSVGQFVVSVERGSVGCTDPNDPTKVFALERDHHALVGGGFRFATGVERLVSHVSPVIVDPPWQFQIANEIHYPRGVVFDGTFLWVANGARYYYRGGRDLREKRWLYKVDPRTREVVDTLDLGGKCDVMGPAGLAWDGAHLWAADVYAQKILQIDPEIPWAPVVGVIPATRKSIEQLVVAEGKLWGLGKANRRRDDVVYQYDRVANKWLDAAPINISDKVTGFYALAGRDGTPYLHVVDDSLQGRIYRLDRKDWSTNPVGTGSEPGGPGPRHVPRFGVEPMVDAQPGLGLDPLDENQARKAPAREARGREARGRESPGRGDSGRRRIRHSLQASHGQGHAAGFRGKPRSGCTTKVTAGTTGNPRLADCLTRPEIVDGRQPPIRIKDCP